MMSVASKPIMLSVIMLNVVMLNVVMLTVVMLTVVEPLKHLLGTYTLAHLAISSEPKKKDLKKHLLGDVQELCRHHHLQVCTSVCLGPSESP